MATAQPMVGGAGGNVPPAFGTPDRDPEDVLAGVVRVSLGGVGYVLPVRSIRANREWKSALEAGTAAVAQRLVEAGGDLPAVLEAAEEGIEPLIDALVSYAPSVLSKDVIESIEPDASMDVIAALSEVWRAASPLVVSLLRSTMVEYPDSSTPSSTSPTPTAGRRRKSKTN